VRDRGGRRRPAAAVVPAARAGSRQRSTRGEKEEEDEKPTVAGSRRRLRIQATTGVLPGGRPSRTARGMTDGWGASLSVRVSERGSSEI
jgi:hypothetical protein